VFTHGVILLDLLNEMTAQFCDNQTAHLWNSKINSRIPGPNDEYQTTSYSFETPYKHAVVDAYSVIPMNT
jgi:hypothetical protein